MFRVLLILFVVPSVAGKYAKWSPMVVQPSGYGSDNEGSPYNAQETATGNQLSYLEAIENAESGEDEETQTERPLPGGLFPQNPSDPHYLKLAWDAIKKVNLLSDTNVIPVKVLKAQSQVVSGVKYYLEVLYGEARCRKIQYAEKCVLKKNGLRSVYRLIIWEQPWLNFQQIEVEKIRSRQWYEEDTNDF